MKPSKNSSRSAVRSSLAIAQPTHCSLLGLVNIQKHGTTLTRETDVWLQLQEITEMGCSRDGHAFENPANYVRVGDSIRIVDYGSPKTREVIAEWGEEIHQRFSLSAQS